MTSSHLMTYDVIALKESAGIRVSRGILFFADCFCRHI